MGGTSTDISLVYDGELRTTKEWYVEYGYPICFPSIEVLTIGAGGGSLAWIDQAGSLHNGPQSAGADPGPACYGRGGTQPTNTDANVVLGRLGTTLVGAMSLDPKAAAQAIEQHVVGPLGLDATEAASAIIQVANANMADAVRLISIRRGYDPREFALVVFGGAGPLHGAALARELSIPTVLVPPNPGITSALGCLLVDIRHDLAADVPPARRPTWIRPRSRRSSSGSRARRASAWRHEGVPEAQMALQRNIAMRYLGQWRSLSVPVDRPLASMDAAVARFHAEHEREYAYRRDDAPVEVYQLQLTAVGVTPKPEFARHAADGGSAPQPIASRDVYFEEDGGFVATPVYVRDDLPAGAKIAGPGSHRPARLDHARPAGRDGRGRRVAQHPHGSRGGAMSTAEQRTLDPVTFEVLKNAFVNTVDQMAEQILRTCHSFVIYARDFSSALCDTDGDTVMQGSQDIAVHVGTLHYTCQGRSSTRSATTCTRATSSPSTTPTWAAPTSTTCASSARSSTRAS